MCGSRNFHQGAGPGQYDKKGLRLFLETMFTSVPMVSYIQNTHKIKIFIRGAGPGQYDKKRSEVVFGNDVYIGSNGIIYTKYTQNPWKMIDPLWNLKKL